MQNRSNPVRAALAATLLAALLGLVGAPATSAADVSLEARGLLAGRFSSGGWLAVAVAIANDGAPVSGYLVADTTDGVVRRLVDLPAGARKQVTLYVQPEAFQRRVLVRFEVDGESLATAEVEVRALESGAGQVVVVGDGAGNLRPQILARGDGAGPEPLALATSDLPERAEPLRGIKAMVWADDSTALSDVQRLSIERWVAAGGHLIVVGGPDWQARTEGFSDILPVEGLAAVDGASPAALATWVGAEAALEAPVTAATGSLTADAMQLVALDDAGTQPLLAVASRGSGRVAYVAVDMATAAFQGWDGSARLWSRLLPDSRLAQLGGFPIEEEASNAMTQALSGLPSLDVPPAELLLAVIVGYILLIGPISYLVLRRVDRRELAWVTAPVLVVLFSACSYGIGASMKGNEIIVNEISLLRTTVGGAAASVQTYAGIFSPNRATYDLAVRADALLAPLRAPAFEPVPVDERAYLMEQGEPARLRGLEVSVFGFQSVRAETVVAYSPNLEVEWRIGDEGITGSVHNTGDRPIEDVAVITPTGGEMIGDLEPGGSDEFSLSANNFNGSAASDQVYGFANFDPNDPAFREVSARREVINSLVGYGGWFPGMESQFSLGGERGPFVIGWIEDAESPVAVEVEGQAVERFSQLVEVIGGRPRLGPGEVTLQPSQLNVQIVSSDGEASTSDPTFVTLGNGEIVFAVALPLEATALEATSVTLLTGHDPMMVIANQGNFGFLPPGYRIEARDPRSGDWVDLGDLSQQSTFEIDDPASILDETGRMEVRVSGAGIPANFGQNPIYVSATIEGVVP